MKSEIQRLINRGDLGRYRVDQAQGNNRDNARKEEVHTVIGVIQEEFLSSIQIKSQIYSLKNVSSMPKRLGEEAMGFADSELVTTTIRVE